MIDKQGLPEIADLKFLIDIFKVDKDTNPYCWMSPLKKFIISSGMNELTLKIFGKELILANLQVDSEDREIATKKALENYAKQKGYTFRLLDDQY
ncbi:hypothetical protein [Priestia aryabhattai]